MKQLLILTVLLFAIPAFATTDIVPRPLSVIEGKGFFTLTAQTPIVAETPSLEYPARLFAQAIAIQTGFEPKITRQAEKKAIKLCLSESLNTEEYTLLVTKSGITITAGTAQGVFYGLQTLRQLILGNQIAAVEVHDKPWFTYRGAMMDSGRHFFPAEEVKKFIDIMALHKLNRFHWHLTEDQGWRIEIKRYPKLTQIGSVRKETIVGFHKTSKEYDGTPYGGFYTQDEIRDIVRYAAERFIEVIPEIEMPGHSVSALASYPELGCTGGPYEVWTKWGISEDIYCAGKETTFEFIENVLTEVLDLFPSRFINIGGDECPKPRWKTCPLCQQRIHKEGLKNEEQLQGYFVCRIEKWLQQRGRDIIGWEEIMQDNITRTATVMSWRDSKSGIAAAQRGNHVIMAPTKNCYLDYYQTADPEKNGEKLAFPRYLPIRQVYRLDPHDQLTPVQQRFVLGVQGNLWTEFIADFDHMQWMALPRLAAIAEIGWAYDRKDFNDFTRRMPALRRIYDAEGYIYAPFMFEGIE